MVLPVTSCIIAPIYSRSLTRLFLGQNFSCYKIADTGDSFQKRQINISLQKALLRMIRFPHNFFYLLLDYLATPV